MSVPKIYAVKVHCGDAHVKGRAKNYRYYISSLFKLRKTKDGRLIFENTGVSTHPRRSFRLCEEDGLELAEKYNAAFAYGYGSLHNEGIFAYKKLCSQIMDKIVSKMDPEQVLSSLFS